MIQNPEQGGEVVAKRTEAHYTGLRTQDGYPVWRTNNSSGLTPQAERWLRQTLRQVVAAGRHYITQEVVYPNTVGPCICIRLKTADKVVYARPLERKGDRHFFLRCVRGQPPDSSNRMTVKLRWLTRIQLSDDEYPQETQTCDIGSGGYELLQAWIGPNVPPNPYILATMAIKEAPERMYRRIVDARFFWVAHAFLLERVRIARNTITEDPPSEWADLLSGKTESNWLRPPTVG